MTQPIVSNEFGTVYTDRVGFYSQKGWFGGGSQEELPMRHITSVRLDITRHVIWGAILVLVGLAAFSAKGAGIAVGILLVLWGALLLWGSPSVRVNTAGNDLRPARGLPWQRPAAEAYVAAVRKALFEKQAA